MPATKTKKQAPPSLFYGMDLTAFATLVAAGQAVKPGPAAGPIRLADAELGAYGEVSSGWGPDGSVQDQRVGFLTKTARVYTKGMMGTGKTAKRKGEEILTLDMDVTGSCLVGMYAPLDATFTPMTPPPEHSRPRVKPRMSRRLPCADLRRGDVFYIWNEPGFESSSRLGRSDTRPRYHVQTDPRPAGKGMVRIAALFNGTGTVADLEFPAETYADIVDSCEYRWKDAGAANQPGTVACPTCGGNGAVPGGVCPDCHGGGEVDGEVFARLASRTDDGFDDIRKVIADATMYGGERLHLDKVDLPAALWKKVHEMLTRMGAKGGSRKGQPYVFETSRSGDLVAFIAGGPPPQPERITKGWVPTPDTLAADVVARFAQLSEVPKRGRMLEPSAAQGALVRAVVAIRPDLDVTAVEPVDERAAQLEQIEQAAGLVFHGTLEDYERHHHATWIRPYDLIVMNPPYSMPHKPQVWIEHVKRAWSMLADGGRLVAIVPHNPIARGDGRAMMLLKLMGPGTVVEPLPADAFKTSGVDVGTCVIAATKSQVPHVASIYRPAPGEPGQELDKPVTTAAAAVHNRVQTWRDFGGQRVARHVGYCIVCGASTWAVDDGGNDPRGLLGLSVVSVLRAAENDTAGPDVCMCYGCADSRIMYSRGLERAHQVWAHFAAEPERGEMQLMRAYLAGEQEPVEHPALFTLASLGAAVDAALAKNR